MKSWIIALIILLFSTTASAQANLSEEEIVFIINDSLGNITSFNVGKWVVGSFKHNLRIYKSSIYGNDNENLGLNVSVGPKRNNCKRYALVLYQFRGNDFNSIFFELCKDNQYFIRIDQKINRIINL